MKRALIAAAALGLFVFGCEEEKKTDLEKAAETVKTESKEAASEAGQATGSAIEKAGVAVKEKAAEIAPETTKAVEDLYTKAKAAVDSGKLEDAKPLIAELQKYLDKVPPEWQEKIKTLAADYAKKAAAGSIQGMPK